MIAILTVASLALAGCNLAQPAEAQTTPTKSMRTLTINGTGKVTLVPDIAYLNIGVRNEAEEVSVALEQNNELALQISAALQEQGVEEKDIQTANFNVYPNQRYDNMGQVTGTYYVVENTVYVTVRDLSNLGKLLDVAISSGANNIYGINFSIEDYAGAQTQARDLAIKDAQQKALDVAGVVGVTLGEVQSINVAGSNYVQPYYGGYGMGGGGAMAAEASVPVSAGQIVITYDVTMIYEVN